MRNYDLLKMDSAARSEGVSGSVPASQMTYVYGKNKLVNFQGNNYCVLGVGVAHLLH